MHRLFHKTVWIKCHLIFPLLFSALLVFWDCLRVCDTDCRRPGWRHCVLRLGLDWANLPNYGSTAAGRGTSGRSQGGYGTKRTLKRPGTGKAKPLILAANRLQIAWDPSRILARRGRPFSSWPPTSPMRTRGTGGKTIEKKIDSSVQDNKYFLLVNVQSVLNIQGNPDICFKFHDWSH